MIEQPGLGRSQETLGLYPKLRSSYPIKFKNRTKHQQQKCLCNSDMNLLNILNILWTVFSFFFFFVIFVWNICWDTTRIIKIVFER